MKFRFQTFVDIQTSASSMQVLQWSVGGPQVLERCRHLFGAYKYFKLGKISVKMVPASTLPVDPLGLSYGDSDPQTVDPRDQMNPGLVRITNGEDVLTDISSFDESTQMAIYNAMMLDPRWSKFMLQSGFRRSAYPLYWQVGQLHQDKYPGSVMNVPLRYTVTGSGVKDNVSSFSFVSNSDGDGASVSPTFVYDGKNSDPHGLFQVGHKGRLGFLPTDYYQHLPVSGSTSGKVNDGANNIPEVSVITCVLPKAYKTVYYYRVFITEEVIFAGLRSAPYITSNGNAYLGLDQHLYSVLAPKPTNGGPLPTLSTQMDNVQNDGQGDI